MKRVFYRFMYWLEVDDYINDDDDDNIVMYLMHVQKPHCAGHLNVSYWCCFVCFSSKMLLIKVAPKTCQCCRLFNNIYTTALLNSQIGLERRRWLNWYNSRFGFVIDIANLIFFPKMPFWRKTCNGWSGELEMITFYGRTLRCQSFAVVSRFFHRRKSSGRTSY